MQPESTTSYIMRTIGMILFVAAILILVTTVLWKLSGSLPGNFSTLSFFIGGLTVTISWTRGSVVMSPGSYLPGTFMLQESARDPKTDLTRKLSFSIIGGFAGLITIAMGIFVSVMA